MKFNYFFIPQGAIAEITENTFKVTYTVGDEIEQFFFDRENSVILDTGNFLQPGIIDHHQPNCGYENTCVAAIVINEAEKFLGHLKGKEEVNIVTHFVPDLDALMSVYYTQRYLEGHAVDSLDQMIGEYVHLVDLGKLVLDPQQPIGIASIWLSYTADVPLSEQKSQRFNENLLEKGLYVMSLIHSFLRSCNDPNPWDLTGIETIEELKEPSQRILQDILAYQEDVKVSRRGIIPLYNNELNGFDLVEVIISRNAKSFLWKYWVRGDRKNTIYGNGFTLTCLHSTEINKAIISTDPTKAYDLKGLGLYIDKLEIGKLLEKGCPIDEIISGLNEQKNSGPRPGFHRNDPWYDGRKTHNFTIIDAPRSGSLLSPEIIDEAIFAFHLWQDLGKRFSLESVDVTTIEELHSSSVLPLEERSFFNKWEANKHIDQELDAANLQLCHEQITNLIAIPSHHVYNEEFGTEIEKICDEEINDVFIYSEKIRSAISSLYYCSYDQAQQLTKAEHWLTALSHFIAKGFKFFSSDTYQNEKEEFILHISDMTSCYFAQELLENCEDLPASAFATLYRRAKPIFKREELFYYLLRYQQNHKKGFKQENFHFIERCIDLNEKDREEQLKLFQLLIENDWDVPYFEEVPIYAYNQIKNYIDDLFYLHHTTNHQNGPQGDVKDFLSTDYKQIFSDDFREIQTEVFEKIKLTFEKEKISLIEELFGERCALLKDEKYKLLNSVATLDKGYRKQKDALSKVLIGMDFQRLSSENFKHSRALLHELDRRNFEVNGEKIIPEKFIKKLELFEELEGLNMMFYRAGRFSNLKHLIGLTGENNFTDTFNELIYSIFRLLTLYTNFNDQDATEEQLKKTTELLGILRLKPLESDTFNTHQLRDKLEIFIPVIHEEINTPVEDTELQIAKCLSQYELITGQNGILSLAAKLPYFYRVRFEDLFNGFKRYYIERLEFFRNDLQALLDESDNGDEEKMTERYIQTCNDLINESVAFDWQELKDIVDSEVYDEEVRALFYEKYFHWLRLNISNSSRDKLYKYNSEVRFAEGRSGEEVRKIVQNLPEKEESITLESLMEDFQLSQIIKHKPTKLIHNAYGFLIEHFIAKYHVDNVRDSIAKFSTKFPWYYHFFTVKRHLRTLFLTLIGLILAAGAFDTNLYNKNTQMAPLSKWMLDHTGHTVFYSLAFVLQIFWGILISLTFIIPLTMFMMFLYKKYILREREEESSKLNFFKLIQTIEGKRSHLLYIPFIIPLLIVVLQMSSKDTIELINKIEGFRFFSTFILVVGLTILAVYNYVKERNENMSASWLIKRTEHMLWLHLIQAFAISIFVIDLILRFQVTEKSFLDDDTGLYFLGMSKYIPISQGPLDVVIMPTFTIMIAILTLFFSFFIERIFGNRE